ncbi:MAG: NeuD/PglB/VioB family sugar acetyltransferase [Oscillospiraceae bacterium]|nr:NeuD/PglB/VioB family sugar acetyltransferase [Oscillospiraceae bacterium]
MKDLIIVGAGGFGRELLQWCKEINAVEPRWNIKGFIDDNRAALDGYECDFGVIGAISDWVPDENEEFVVALGFPAVKRRVIESLVSRGANIVSLIHPEARIGGFCNIGKGCIIYPDTRITVNVTIGDYVTILSGNFIGHDASIGSYSTLFGGCSVNGHVVIGERTLLNNHASTVPGIRIGSDVNVGAGSFVVSNVKDGRHVFGNPARKI